MKTKTGRRKPKVWSQVLSKGIRGKRVDFVEHHFEEGKEELHVGIAFTDRTYLSLRFHSQIVRESAELLDGHGNVRKSFQGVKKGVKRRGDTR